MRDDHRFQGTQINLLVEQPASNTKSAIHNNLLATKTDQR